VDIDDPPHAHVRIFRRLVQDRNRFLSDSVCEPFECLMPDEVVLAVRSRQYPLDCPRGVPQPLQVCCWPSYHPAGRSIAVTTYFWRTASPLPAKTLSGGSKARRIVERGVEGSQARASAVVGSRTLNPLSSGGLAERRYRESLDDVFAPAPPFGPVWHAERPTRRRPRRRFGSESASTSRPERRPPFRSAAPSLPPAPRGAYPRVGPGGAPSP
jgi:hypothetical protein